MEVENAPLDVRRGELIRFAWLRDLTSVDREYRRGRLEATHARTRECRLEAQPQGVARAGRAGEVEPTGTQCWLDEIPLASE
jgi:hypothetical protein